MFDGLVPLRVGVGESGPLPELLGVAVHLCSPLTSSCLVTLTSAVIVTLTVPSL